MSGQGRVGARERERLWNALVETAALVRAGDDDANAADDERAGSSATRARSHRARAVRVGVAAVVVGIAGANALSSVPRRATADGTADSDLFALTNQDRASNGIASLQYHSTLASIGEAKPYSGCGYAVDGRSYDMIQRNYFAHPILNCGGQYVFNMMQADGVGYRSAGENIGWSSNSGSASSSANYINTAFMNSPDHRANILNASYTHVGMGSDGPVSSWSGAGGSYPNVWMFSEEFAQLSSTPATAPPAPAPTHAPTPRPTPRPTPVPTLPPPPPRNEPAPPAPSLPPAEQTAVPTPVPTPTPAPTPTSTPEAPAPRPTPTAGVAAATTPPLIWTPSGLLGDSIEAVLEGYLLD